ncbi:hypothetical protein IVB08_34590 [Bradyrhizobium sp. 173]|uniref:hypothetical protein n=1 Tax=Bradyrhizobium sp. 173 TaxID=2782644 RepID=UPI001FF7B7AD|nr:hypothetical protein [Bradyrhizobium sp. 173]MCK1568989.1 hypothetical protein [Bradyrhizobium sp. 173]
MSTTEAQARAAVRAQLPGSAFAFPIYWQGDDAPTLLDTPAAFAFVVFNNEGSGGRPAAFGGGRGRNLFRNRALVEAYVFSPIGAETGADAASGRAELIAARLRGFRDNDISVFSADVIFIGPGSSISVPGVTAPNNYQCAVAEISLTFDQIG